MVSSHVSENMSTKVSKDDIFSWIERILKSENFKNLQVSVTGTSETGDGFLGDIVFTKVNGITNKDEEKILNLVIKHGKNNKHLRNSTPVRSAFEVEIYVYDKIFPTFRKFEIEKAIEGGFNSVPKYFGHLLFDNMEVIILENLKEIDYELYDKKIPLNLNHQKAVLRQYGRFHALSFAMRDQKREEFEALATNIPEDTFFKFVQDNSLPKAFENAVIEARNVLCNESDFELYEKFRTAMGRNAGVKLRELLHKKDPQSVISHGDCWNNNFMYKYENSDKTTPSKVAILDWQISSLRSPVFDLSYFIYVTSSKEGLEKFNELINEYYASFSSFFRQLGSDPDVIFPFSDLKAHWKKYSFFGLIFLPLVLMMVLCKKENIPKLEEMEEGQQMGDMFKAEIVEEDSFRERFIAGLNNHFNYVL